MTKDLHTAREWDERCPENIEYQTMHLEKGKVTKVTATVRSVEWVPQARKEVSVCRHVTFDGYGHCYSPSRDKRIPELDISFAAG